MKKIAKKIKKQNNANNRAKRKKKILSKKEKKITPIKLHNHEQSRIKNILPSKIDDNEDSGEFENFPFEQQIENGAPLKDMNENKEQEVLESEKQESIDGLQEIPVLPSKNDLEYLDNFIA